MSPTVSIAKKNISIRFAVTECSLGSIIVAASDVGLCFIALGDDANALVCELEDRFPNAHLSDGDTSFEKVVAKVVALVEKNQTKIELPLDMQGTAFQQRVWREFRKIPLGQTATYSDIAKRMGEPRAMRAVAQACGANKLAIVIPCHRVIRTDGSLSGYRWGIERKAELLRREKQ